jgi:hypothetical protein
MTTRSSKRLSRAFAAVLALGSGISAPPARAQSSDEPTAADVASATQLYTVGRELREKGDLTAALEKLRAAHALVETPITAVELARTYEMLGKLVEAREMASTVPRIPVRRNESEKSVAARADAEAMVRTLKPRLAQITVRIVPPQERPPHLIVDDVTIPAEAISAERVVNPGPHVVVLRSDVSEARAEVSLAEGEKREVTLDLSRGDEKQGGRASSKTTPGPVVYVGFVTAGAGVLIGTVTGIVALSKASSLKGVCNGSSCPPSSQNELDAANTFATTSTVSFVVGGVAAAVGIAALLIGTSPASPPPSSAAKRGAWISPWVGPGAAGVRGAF